MDSKNLSIGTLLEFYLPLLTKKQADALDLYYNQDLSLSEIAEHMNITRQGVRDNIKRGEKQLTEYESALHLSEKFLEITTVCSIVKNSAAKIKQQKNADENSNLAEEIIYGIEKIESVL